MVHRGVSAPAPDRSMAPRLLLASASPRRRELVARLGMTPSGIAASDIDETPCKGELPRDYARRMAREKALAAPGGDAFVLAGDTVVALGRRILPKAEDEATAQACLALLSGRHRTALTWRAGLTPHDAR